jgi:hypothetical protein
MEESKQQAQPVISEFKGKAKAIVKFYDTIKKFVEE